MLGKVQREWARTVARIGVAIVMASGGVAHADSADSITSGITAKAGNPQDYTTENSTRGRENKANKSKNGANTGAIVAAIAGAGLVAAAVPKLASGVPTEIAIGAALMAKAGLEFAQSAASAKTGGQNGAQEGALRLAYDESKSNVSAASAAQIQNQVAQTIAQNPELASTLQQRGVDPQQFASQLASGQIQSTDQVLSAMKNNVAIDANTMAQAEAAATAHTTQAVGEAMAKVSLQENAQTSGTAAAAPGAAPGSAGGVNLMGGFGGGADKKGHEGELAGANPEPSRTPSVKDAGIAEAGKAPSTAAAAGGFAGVGGIQDELLEKLMSGFGGLPTNKKEDTAVSDKEKDPLLALGVRRPVGKMTLFQLAHRNFRSYREWRTKKMLADKVKVAAAAAKRELARR